MPRPGAAALASLKTLFETKRGKVLPLPPKLVRLYGCLRMPLPRSHPHVFSNFVTTLDGVVSLNTKGHASGGDISGFSAQDRMVMGLLRAIADAVIIGSGTLGAGAPRRRAVPDSRAADCRPRRWRPTPQPCHGKGVRAARCPMGELDRHAARQQPPVSALRVP